jgi:FkbM family methyltransferase
MRKIFLDVGANTGQTLAAALDPVFAFDRIVCFEPASICWSYLSELADERTFIARFGLWNQNCERPLIEPGRKGASIWKKEKSARDDRETCEFRRASEWFRQFIDEGDEVFLKLNCEGAECDILDDLLDSDEFRKVSYAMIDFDVRKIDSQKHREREVRERLKRAGIGFPRVAFARDVMIGETHGARIKNWLKMIGA